jgi:hypothetical protein
MKFTAKHFESLARNAKHVDAAQRSAAILNGKLDPESIEDVAKWSRSCYTQPRKSELKMAALDSLLDCHGVESLRSEDGELLAKYLNTGDAYTETVLRVEETGEYLLTTYGDFLEEWERENATEDSDDMEEESDA